MIRLVLQTELVCGRLHEVPKIFNSFRVNSWDSPLDCEQTEQVCVGSFPEALMSPALADGFFTTSATVETHKNKEGF